MQFAFKYKFLLTIKSKPPFFLEFSSIIIPIDLAQHSDLD